MQNIFDIFLLKKKLYGNLLSPEKVTGRKSLITLKNSHITYALLRITSETARVRIIVDGNYYDFTGSDLLNNNVTVDNLRSDITLTPLVAYTDGHTYLIKFLVRSFTELFEIVIMDTEGKTVDVAYQVEVVTHGRLL